MNYVIAKIISTVLDPIVLTILAILIILLPTDGSTISVHMILYTGSILAYITLPWIIFVAWAKWTKQISNWDMSVRAERTATFTKAIPLFLLEYAGIWLIGNEALIRVATIYIGILLLYFLITKYWTKASGHMTTLIINTAIMYAMTKNIYILFSLFLTIPLLAVSRKTLKRHSVAELIVGTLFGSICGGAFILFL